MNSFKSDINKAHGYLEDVLKELDALHDWTDKEMREEIYPSNQLDAILDDLKKAWDIIEGIKEETEEEE